MDNLAMLFEKPIEDGFVKVYENDNYPYDDVADAWYRYEDHPGYDWASPEIRMRRLRVIRHTPKGVWLDDWSVPRFVLNDARKRYAYPTKELARESFLKRKRKQLGYLSTQHDHVAAVLKTAERIFA